MAKVYVYGWLFAVCVVLFIMFLMFYRQDIDGITKEAVARKDPGFCEGIQLPMRIGCYKEVAKATADPKICLLIMDRGYQYSCIESTLRVVKDENFCYSLEDPEFRDLCLLQMVSRFGHLRLCGDVADGRSRDNCIRAVAEGRNELELCANVSGMGAREECIGTIASRGGDVSVCDRVSDNIVRYECYGSVAVNLGDSTLCLRIPVNVTSRFQYWYPARYNCLSGVASKTRSLEVCELLGNVTVNIPMEGGGYAASLPRETCIAGVGVVGMDEGICRNITPGGTRDGCYYGIAQKSPQKSGLCLKIEGDSERDYCLLVAGIQYRDPNLCGQIANATEKEICRNGIK